MWMAIKKKPCISAMRLLSFLTGIVLIAFSCSEKSGISHSSLILKTGVAYTSEGSFIPQGGKIRIGLLASGGGAPLTYVRIERVTAGEVSLQVDKGIYVATGGYDEDFVFAKDSSDQEIWVVTVMNADRDTVVKRLNVFRASGSAYGDIHYYPSLSLGFQDNTLFGHFVDVDSGIVYDNSTIQNLEGTVDLLGYYYITSGLPSPSLTCPAYTAAIAYYPELGTWPVKNNTLYDYASTDNNLISIDQFDEAQNDSLLVSAYIPGKVSGNCKYCYTGKVIPFKTQEGKYGLVKVIRADQSSDGSMEIAIKVQK